MALIGSQIARGTGPTGLRSTPDWIRMFSTVVRLTPTSPATYRAELVQLHHALADTFGRATFRDDGPVSDSSGRRTKLNGGVGGVLS